MILSFISQKGGSGKTTLSVNLAALASSDGVRVAIVDLDPQASASAWCAARGTDDIRHEACHPPLLARTLERLREAGIALIVIDTPPHNSTAAANAIRASERHQEKIMTKNAPDFAGFATRASQAKKPTPPLPGDADVVRHL